MTRWPRAHTLCILVALINAPALAQPPRPADPPTYDCAPGKPDGATKTCRCPDGYEPRFHLNKIPYCFRLPKGKRAPKATPAADP